MRCFVVILCMIMSMILHAALYCQYYKSFAIPHWMVKIIKQRQCLSIYLSIKLFYNDLSTQQRYLNIVYSYCKIIYTYLLFWWTYHYFIEKLKWFKTYLFVMYKRDIDISSLPLMMILKTLFFKEIQQTTLTFLNFPAQLVISIPAKM